MANKPNKVILHCSATPNTRNVKANQIDKWHRERGFKKIGYHRVICRDGLIEHGRFDFEIGAHTQGKNQNSLGICLIGMNDFTVEQINSLCGLYLEYLHKYGIDYNSWFCHYQFNKGKTCPNIPIEVVRALLKNLK